MNDKQEMSKDSDLRLAADNLEYFISYVSSPWRIVWMNFVAGVFRGLGAVIGASIVIALIIWLLGLFTQVPLIGEYMTDINQVVSGYVYKTDYNDELDRMGDTLQRIEETLKKAETKQ